MRKNIFLCAVLLLLVFCLGGCDKLPAADYYYDGPIYFDDSRRPDEGETPEEGDEQPGGVKLPYLDISK